MTKLSDVPLKRPNPGPPIEARTVVERTVEAPGVTLQLRTTGHGLFLALRVKYDHGGPPVHLTGGQLRALYRLLNAGAQEKTE